MGGSGSLSVVVAPQTCSWSAAPDQPWVQLTSGASGTGDGTVDYSVDANSGEDSRTAVIAVDTGTDAEDFAISQQGYAGALDVTWAPSEPEIGETVVFTVSNQIGELQQVDWDFGIPGCASYSQNTTCVPDPYTDCSQQAFQFSAGGSATVAATVTIGGIAYGPVERTVNVLDQGTCSDELFADGFESGDTGAWGVSAP
jgi:hypothetical protein